MQLATGIIEGWDLSTAWLNGLKYVSDTVDRRVFHLVTRISRPDVEVPEIRAAVDGILADRGLDPVETVANTIFPRSLAESSPDHQVLGDRYRRMYPVIRRLHQSNQRGTYFGRMVEYPAAGGSFDQLSDLIAKLAHESAKDKALGARYEMQISIPGIILSPEDGAQRDLTGEVYEPVEEISTYAAGRDNAIMAFPCLSWCSFQLDRGYLHLAAHYRSQYLLQRGYGNYLGLARLTAYVAKEAGLGLGSLLVVAGSAKADAPKYVIKQAIEAAPRA